MGDTEPLDKTTDWGISPSTEIQTSPTCDPPRIGRYRVIRRLGRGGFGLVYLAQDDELERPVAIKVLDPERISRPGDVEAYLAEARTLAHLDHPGIVPIHDFGRADDGRRFIVSKFIEGCDLARLISVARPSHGRSAALMADVAEALHHAHARGLVHRDIKPANILIDASGKPYVADFGLALREEDHGKGFRRAGTPAYMSPEQARGEGHRVDRRSDIFSLGVVFYELLTGKKPFRGECLEDLLEAIASSEPRPPRRLDETIPRELERICLRALSKPVSGRYATAGDMAEDLRAYPTSPDGRDTAHAVTIASAPATPPGSTEAATPPSSTSGRPDPERRPSRIVPNGLRSFDERDADFFLELLPGVRDRDGLPEGLRYWKTRIEPIDPDKTFKVGLIYGPSGCGKSSLVKAGLIPRLARHIHPVYVEATPDETETRLLSSLRKAYPALPASLGLVDSVASMRRGGVLGEGRKVLLIIDQCEQWLLARHHEQGSELVAALRQCDGEHVQAIVMVRDDFWMAATRLMKDVEIDLMPDRNVAPVDLFDLRHAYKVLMAFGQAYGAIPEKQGELSREHRDFLDLAISGLGQDGKVTPVRLVLFAEMMKGKTWTTATLKRVGGTAGLGLTFLEETFSSPRANPKHRLHQRAARGLLKALLPSTVTDIKGGMKSEAELRETSGYANHPEDFDEVIRILDAELRLITPTDPESSEDGDRANKLDGVRYYQLAHDYLVPSLRRWLTLKQRETRQGRAEITLAERSATWSASPENRQLPSLVEWATILLWTRSRDHTEPERRMMRQATRVHGLRGLGMVALVTALMAWGLNIQHQAAERNRATVAAGLVEQVLRANTGQVPDIVASMSDYRRWVDPALKRAIARAAEGSPEKLHASLALLPTDASQVDYLCGRLLAASVSEVPILRQALKSHSARLTPVIWSALDSARPDEACLLSAAAALALYDPDNPRWSEVGGKVARSIVTVNPIFLGPWIDALRPAKGKLTAPLAVIFRDQGRPETERTLATSVLADYAADEPDLLANLLMDADPRAYATLFPIAERQARKVVPVFRAEIAKISIPNGNSDGLEPAKDRLAERRARSAIALVRMGDTEEVWPLLRHGADPRLRSFIVNCLSLLGADPRSIILGLDGIGTKASPVAPGGERKTEAALFHPETSIRRALILALGSYDPDVLSEGERAPLIDNLLDLYRNDPDAGIHGATDWTLRRWKQGERLEVADAELMKAMKSNAWKDRRWFVNELGQTFAVIEMTVEDQTDSPPKKLGRGNAGRLRNGRIPRRFWIASKEVTNLQYRRFVEENPQYKFDLERNFSPEPLGPVVGVRIYEAAAFCNWLSKAEGLEPCYEPNPSGLYAEGMRFVPNYLERSGYRLPTQAEWEYACRAATTTAYYFGGSAKLLGEYAIVLPHSENHAWAVGHLKPNDLGLFDLYGNAWEWTQSECFDPGTNGGKDDLDEQVHGKLITDKIPILECGGAFFNGPSGANSSVRDYNRMQDRNPGIGFRIARTCP